MSMRCRQQDLRPKVVDQRNSVQSSGSERSECGLDDFCPCGCGGPKSWLCIIARRKLGSTGKWKAKAGSQHHLRQHARSVYLLFGLSCS